MPYIPLHQDLPLKSILTPDHLAHIENGIVGNLTEAQGYADRIAVQIQAGQVTDATFDAAVDRAAADGRLVVEGGGGEAAGVEIIETQPGAYQFTSGPTEAMLYGLTTEQKLPAAAKSDLRTEFTTNSTLDSTVGGYVNNATSTTYTAVKGIVDSAESAVRASLTPGNGARPVGRGELYTNVKDHGVVGDGVTDDTAAINALFASIGTPGGPRRIYFPHGQYLHNGVSITGKSGFEIHGPGELVAKTERVWEYFAVVNCQDFKILGLASRHQNPTARRTTSPARTFSITGSTRFHISNCHAHHGEGVGIMLNHCSYATVDNNLVQFTKADGIGLYGDTHHVTVTGNTTFETGDDGIAQVGVISQGVRPHDNAVSGNVIGRSYARGIVAVGAYNATITGNTIEYTRAGGIYIATEVTRNTYGASNIVVSSNVVKDVNFYEPDIEQAGIFIFGDTSGAVEDITVIGNRVENARKEGIRIGGDSAGTHRIHLTSNTVRTAGGSGLAIRTVTDLSVVGNSFTDTVGSGITSTAGTSGAVTILGNTVRKPNTAGGTAAAISMTSSTNAVAVITGNTIMDATTALYGIDAPPQATVFGNNLNGTTPRGGATGTTQLYGNLSIASVAAPANAADGRGVLAVRNASVPPTTNPSNGGIIYVETGALKYRGSSGTVTVLGPA